MSNNNDGVNAAGGVGFIGLLQIVFIVLKLCNVITWKWWVVLLPIEIEVVALFLLLALACIIYRKN